MRDIKTRESRAGSVKTIDRASMLSYRMKQATFRGKEQARNYSDYGDQNATSYAEDNTFAIAEDTVYAGGSVTKRGVQGTENLVKNARFERKNADNANFAYEMGRKRAENKADFSRRKTGTVTDELGNASNTKLGSTRNSGRLKRGISEPKPASVMVESNTAGMAVPPAIRVRSIENTFAPGANRTVMSKEKAEAVLKRKYQVKKATDSMRKRAEKAGKGFLVAVRRAVNSSRMLVGSLSVAGSIALIAIIVCTFFGSAFYILGNESNPDYIPGEFVGVGNEAIVEVAAQQVGNVGGRPYWSWYGFYDRVEWCACFVSWCAHKLHAALTLVSGEQFSFSYFSTRFLISEIKRIQPDMTLQDIYPDWLAYKELHTSASSTTLRIDSDWKRFYKDTKIAKMPLRRLTKVVLDEWVHSMIKQYEMDKTMYYNFSGIIRQCLDYAVDKEIINENNFRKVRVDGRRMFKKKKKKSSESQVYSKDELKGLMELAWKDYYERTKVYQLAPLAVMMQFETGVRIGEVCVLRYEDIDGSYLHVRRMLRRDCRQVVDHTKGGHEDRVVILTSDARNIIDKCRERQLELGVDSDGYIFSVDGNYCSYGAIADLYRKYCDKLGIQMKSSHKSRKTFISTLLDANMNANTVREMVGHADERTTLQSYHFDRSTEDERVMKMEEALKLEDD